MENKEFQFGCFTEPEDMLNCGCAKCTHNYQTFHSQTQKCENCGSVLPQNNFGDYLCLACRDKESQKDT